jgi:hypothetical protein
MIISAASDILLARAAQEAPPATPPTINILFLSDNFRTPYDDLFLRSIGFLRL